MKSMKWAIVAALAALPAPVSAQQVLPQFGIDPVGLCRRVMVRDVLTATQVPLGCISGGSFQPNGSPFLTGIGTPTAGQKMAFDFVADDPAAPIANLGGLWPARTYAKLGISRSFTAAQGDPSSPVIGVLSSITNLGSAGDGVALMGVGVARAPNTVVFAGNLIAGAPPNSSNVKLVGLEIDVQPGVGSTLNSASGGLFINTFDQINPVAILIGSGGTNGGFTNGINFITNIQDAAIAPSSGVTIGTLIDSGGATYGQNAPIKLSRGHAMGWRGVGGNLATEYVDATGTMHKLLPDNGGGYVIRDFTDSTPLFTFNPTGDMIASSTVRAPALVLTSPSTPASSSAPCTPGQIAYDASYIYICVASATWKRSALSSF